MDSGGTPFWTTLIKEWKKNEEAALAAPFGAKMQSSALYCGPKGRPFSGENAISENDLASMCLLMFKVPLQSELYFLPLWFLQLSELHFVAWCMYRDLQYIKADGKKGGITVCQKRTWNVIIFAHVYSLNGLLFSSWSLHILWRMWVEKRSEKNCKTWFKCYDVKFY